MCIAVCLPDGISVRNFVNGGFLTMLAQEPLLLHEFSPGFVQRLSARMAPNAEWLETPREPEGPLRHLIRRSLGYAHMHCANTRSMRYNLSRRLPGSLRSRVVRRVAQLVGRASATQAGVSRLERTCWRLVRRSTTFNDCRELLRRRRPSLIFCTSQRALSALPLVLAANSLGIPTATFVVSWDNMTSKARIAAPFDHYLVWSAHMRDELRRYYPAVRDQQIHIVGSPQFDWYSGEGLRLSREQFFRRIGANPERPLICYSGGDPESCPEDPDHVRILMELIRQGQVLGRPQLLLRPSPADPELRYRHVLADYPEIILQQPAWEPIREPGKAPTAPPVEDSHFLANLTSHTDVNVNVASTMTLDFSINDTPVVNIAFDVADPEPGRPCLWEHYYAWEHYRPVVDVGAARFARSRQELARHINAYLDDPALDREGRRRLVELQLGVPIGQAGARTAHLLGTLAN